MTRSLLAILAFGLSFACPAFAIEPPGGEEAAEEPRGILPIPDYGGDIWNRSYLTGDWGGLRTTLANKGFQFDVDYVQWFDQIVDGGKNGRLGEYGGNLTYNLKFDLDRAGILPGGFLQARAETRYGDSGILNTGQIVPNNTAALSPTNYSDFDEGYDIALTHLAYTQFLSPKIGVILGKLDLYGDGDQNEFAGGRGRTQFMNWSLNYGTPLLFVPASTIGAGILFLPNENLTLTTMLIRGTECTHSDCFEDLDDTGGVALVSASYQYRLAGRPGGVAGTYGYFFDCNFTDIDSVSIVPGVVPSTSKNSWIVTVSFWQYVFAKGTHDGPLDLTNRQPDLQGWGVFGRLSFADEDVNPWKYSFAVGLGGRGILDFRPNDLFGVGYFYNDETNARFVVPLRGSGQGAEVFYNVAITPAVKFSVNLQFIRSAELSVDNTTMLTGRLQINF